METNNQEPSVLDLNKLSSQERKQRLYMLLKSFPAHIGYKERLHTIAARADISTKSLLQLARRNGWQAQLATELAAEKEREEYAKQLEATAPLTTNIPVTRIAANVKGLVWVLLSASRRFIDTCSIMLSYYSERIALRVAEAGGVAQLDEVVIKEIAGWQTQLNYYAKALQPYMAPGPISTLLNTIDFTSRLPISDESVETSHFTVAALQAKMLELGMSSAFQNPTAATEGFTTEPLPIISGWVNTSMTSPIEYFNENEPDKL